MSNKQNKIDSAAVEALSAALEKVFGEGESAQRFIHLNRVPLICQSIVAINENIEEIKTKLENKFVTNDVFTPVKNVVYGLVGSVLLTVIGAMLYMIIPNS